MRRGGAIAGRALVRVGRLGRCCPGEQGCGQLSGGEILGHVFLH
jgi:hypothetical protein